LVKVGEEDTCSGFAGSTYSTLKEAWSTNVFPFIWKLRFTDNPCTSSTS